MPGEAVAVDKVAKSIRTRPTAQRKGRREGGCTTLRGVAPRVGFFGAAAHPWKGLWFLVRTPRAWPFAIVPIVVASLLVTLVTGSALAWLVPTVGDLVGSSTAWYATAGKVARQVLTALLAFLFGVILAVVLSQPLSSPALERLVRLAERELGMQERPQTSLLLDLWRSARSAAIGSTGIALVLTLTLIDFLVPGSTVVVLPIKIVLSGLFISWDLLDYPLSVRDLGLRERLRWIWGHLPEVFGFGISLALVFLVPCMQLLLLPAGVVGATSLLRAVELAERGET